MPVQRLKTNKLFFNKWPYKIECTLSGAWAASPSRLNDKSFANWLKAPEVLHQWAPKNATPIAHKQRVIELRDTVQLFQDDIKTRGEKDNLSIYCKDTSVFVALEAALSKWTSKIWEPGSDKALEFLLNNNTRTTVCDKFPHNNCRYKISLKDNIPIDLREKFYVWSKKYPAQVIMAKSTTEWMSTAKLWSYSPFMYVVDDKILTLVGLYLAEHIKHIEEFILRDSINTP